MRRNEDNHMDGRERFRRALRFQRPDRAPRDLWALPGIRMYRQDELEAVRALYPPDLTGPDFKYGPSLRARGTPAEVGTYVDEWGCPWTVAEPGVVGEVKDPPLADWSALDHYQPPWEMLREADFSRVNASCAATDRFVLRGTMARPFERMQFLRGSENLYVDLGYGAAEMYRLREMLHDFYCREMELWAQTDVDGISFMDDWGTQKALLIAPAMWRELFKPLYADYCRIIHGAGKFAFFHSDGHISAIIPDLIEIGVDAVNSQLFCQDIEELGRRFKGQITFWGEIDRQWVLPFGSAEQVREAVQVGHLDAPVAIGGQGIGALLVGKDEQQVRLGHDLALL